MPQAAIDFHMVSGLVRTVTTWVRLPTPRWTASQSEIRPERVGAIGPGVLWDMGHWLLFANGYHEVGALNRPEGNKVVLRLQWLPSRKGSTDRRN